MILPLHREGVFWSSIFTFKAWNGPHQWALKIITMHPWNTCTYLYVECTCRTKTNYWLSRTLPGEIKTAIKHSCRVLPRYCQLIYTCPDVILGITQSPWTTYLCTCTPLVPSSLLSSPTCACMEAHFDQRSILCTLKYMLVDWQQFYVFVAILGKH